MVEIQLMKKMIEEIIDQNLFEVSASAFATTIGGSKSFSQRLKDGSAGDKAVMQTWERMKSYYRVADETIINFVHNYREAKEIRRSLEKLLNSKQKSEFLQKTTALFGSLIYGDSRNRPLDVLSEEKWNNLLDMRYMQPMNFSEMLAILYLMLTKTDNTSVSLKRSLEVSIPGLLRILSGSNDGHMNTDVHEMAANYMAETESLDNTKTGLLEKAVRPEMLIYAFLCPHFKEAFQDAYYKLPGNELSYWVDEKTIGSTHPQIYALLDTITENMPNGGVYNLCKIQLHGKIKVEHCQYLGLIEEGKDSGRAICSSYFREKKKEMNFYEFSYDKKQETISFTVQSTAKADQKTEHLFPLPERLHYLNEQEKKRKEDSQIFHDYLFGHDDEIYDKILEELMSHDGISYIDNIDIVDVSISRRYLTLTLLEKRKKEEEEQDEKQEETNYRILLREHPSFYNISPGHKVFICKHTDDGKLYAEWVEPHYALCLDEFEKL